MIYGNLTFVSHLLMCVVMQHSALITINNLTLAYKNFTFGATVWWCYVFYICFKGITTTQLHSERTKFIYVCIHLFQNLLKSWKKRTTIGLAWLLLSIMSYNHKYFPILKQNKTKQKWSQQQFNTIIKTLHIKYNIEITKIS